MRKHYDWWQWKRDVAKFYFQTIPKRSRLKTLSYRRFGENGGEKNVKYIFIYIYEVFNKKLKNVSCEYNRLNGWNSTLQAAWYIRSVRIIWFLWTKPTIWLLIRSYTQNIVRACSMFYHINHDTNVRRGKQNPCRGRWL